MNLNTKYKIDEKVFFMYEGKVKCGKVVGYQTYGTFHDNKDVVFIYMVTSLTVVSSYFCNLGFGESYLFRCKEDCK